MDDLDNDVTRTIDDHVDDTELLPFRYQKYASRGRTSPVMLSL